MMDRENYVEALRSGGTRLLFELGTLFDPQHDIFGVAAPFKVVDEQKAQALAAMATIRSVLLDPRLVARFTGKPKKEITPKAKAPRTRSKYLY